MNRSSGLRMLAMLDQRLPVEDAGELIDCLTGLGTLTVRQPCEQLPQLDLDRLRPGPVRFRNGRWRSGEK